jgi:maltose O-acetyltransferase
MKLLTFLQNIDEQLNDWLLSNAASLPLRWRKWLAGQYPDARVRKTCWASLNVHMGEQTFANPGLVVVNTMDSDAAVTIGSHVSIAPGVILVTDSSPNNSRLMLAHPTIADNMVQRAPIRIGDHCWIGAGAIILPGVTIGPRSVIGAGAVVRADVREESVIAGVPARTLRHLVFDQPS